MVNRCQGGYLINTQAFNIHFWGVRGSCSVSSVDRQKFGSNTSCIEVRCGEKRLIFDAGTGICELGNSLSEDHHITGHIFITHTHWDHIQGLPYFMPGYKRGNRFHVYGERKKTQSFEEVIKGLMAYPYFPVSWDMMKADYTFHEISSSEEIIIGDVKVKTISINHPDTCLGYRIDYGGHSCCYISDYEYIGKSRDAMLAFIDDVDVFICDTTFTDEEYATRKGWGHTTWEQAVVLAQEAQVKKLILFHHDLFRSDLEIEAIEKEAQSRFTHTVAAHDGMTITL